MQMRAKFPIFCGIAALFLAATVPVMAGQNKQPPGPPVVLGPLPPPPLVEPTPNVWLPIASPGMAGPGYFINSRLYWGYTAPPPPTAPAPPGCGCDCACDCGLVC